MAQATTAKLFRNGASQAVRLPAEFRFEGSEVYISRDEATGDVILSTRPDARVWADFFRSLRHVDTSDFMVDRPMNRIPEEKDIFHMDADE